MSFSAALVGIVAVTGRGGGGGGAAGAGWFVFEALMVSPTTLEGWLGGGGGGITMVGC